MMRHLNSVDNLSLSLSPFLSAEIEAESSHVALYVCVCVRVREIK